MKLWHHALVALVVWGMTFTGFAVVAGPGLVTYMRGTPTTAHVDDCTTEYHHRRGHQTRTTVCSGTWTINGVRHSGKVEGATESDEGRTIHVRATERSASDSNTPRMTVFMAVFGVVAGVFGHIVVLFLIRSIRNRVQARMGPANGMGTWNAPPPPPWNAPPPATWNSPPPPPPYGPRR